MRQSLRRSGFYETAGRSQVFISLTVFAVFIRPRCFYPHLVSQEKARCILVSDYDEWVLLSKARPLMA
jgi:hypothetical protein